MMSETKGKRLGTLRCRGLKPPVIRGHATAFKYWFNAFGHTGPYSQSVEEINGIWKVIPKGNPMIHLVCLPFFVVVVVLFSFITLIRPYYPPNLKMPILPNTNRVPCTFL